MACNFVMLGALTAKPYAFVSRSWELNKVTTFDFTSSDLPFVHFFYRGTEIIKVLPFGSLSEGEWAPNRTRFFFEGFKIQRLTSPFMRLFNTRMHSRVNWLTSFAFFLVFAEERFLPNSFFTKFGYFNRLASKSVCIDFVNGFADFNQLVFLKLFLSRFGFGQFYSGASCRPPADSFLYEWRPFYMPSQGSLVSTVSSYGTGEASESVDFLFFFFNPRLENPLLNAKFRALSSGFSNILTFGSSAGFFNYRVYDLGVSFLQLGLFLQGRHRFCRYFAASPSFNKLVVIYGLAMLTSYPLTLSSSRLFALFQHLGVIFQSKLQGKSIEFFPFFQHPTFIAELEIGYLGACWTRSKPSSILYINENNEVDIDPNAFNLVVYQGFQAEYSMRFSDLVFPTLAYFEDYFAGWRNDGRFMAFEHNVPSADTNALNSFSIVENLNKFIVQQRGARLSCSRGSVVNLSKNGAVVRFLNRNIYKFFLNFSLQPRACGIFSKFSYFLRYLEILRPGILVDTNRSILLRLWVMELRYSSRSVYGRLPNIPIVPTVKREQSLTTTNWYRFFLILETLIFKNMAFLADNYYKRSIQKYQPRFFNLFGGGFRTNFVRESFDILAFTCTIDPVLEEFTIFPFLTRFRRLQKYFIQRTMVKRMFFSPFTLIVKKFITQICLRLCTVSIKKFKKVGLVNLQAQLFFFEKADLLCNFSYFGDFSKVFKNLHHQYFYFIREDRLSLLTLTFPNFSTFLEFHYSSVVRLSKTLFLEGQYFRFSLYNFFDKIVQLL